MITLTTPPTLNTVLGGNVPVAYDKLVIGPINCDPTTMSLFANVRLIATANLDMNSLLGTLSVMTGSNLLELAIPQINFLRKVRLTGPQNASVVTIINNTQNSVETGLISLGVITGSHTPGV